VIGIGMKHERKRDGWTVWAVLLGLVLVAAASLVGSFYLLNWLLARFWQFDLSAWEYSAGFAALVLVCIWHDIRRRRRLDAEHRDPTGNNNGRGAS
jgi:membrane protein implicated in regulation of membrane protease activity